MRQTHILFVNAIEIFVTDRSESRSFVPSFTCKLNFHIVCQFVVNRHMYFSAFEQLSMLIAKKKNDVMQLMMVNAWMICLMPALIDTNRWIVRSPITKNMIYWGRKEKSNQSHWKWNELRTSSANKWNC